MTSGNWTRLDADSLTEVWSDGATVKRSLRPSSPAVRSLLRWFEEQNLPFVPRSLGHDGGYEFVSFIQGTIAKRPWPKEILSTEFIYEFGAILRHIHRASVGFILPAGETFSCGPGAPLKEHVVCHGDLGPWNTVIRDGRISGIIDWDFAYFGGPIEDLVVAALEFVPWRSGILISEEELPADFAPRRLEALCAGYGDFQPMEVVAQAPQVLRTRASETRKLATAGNALFRQLEARNIPSQLEEDAARIEELFLGALSKS